MAPKLSTTPKVNNKPKESPGISKINNLLKKHLYKFAIVLAFMEMQAQLNPNFTPGDNFVEVDLYDASGTNNHAGFIKGLKTANAVGMQDRRTQGLTFVGKIADDNFDINQPINPPTNNNSILRPTAGGTATAMQTHIISLGLPNQNERFVWLQTNVNFPDFTAAAAARFQGIDVVAGGQGALNYYVAMIHEMFYGHGAQNGHNSRKIVSRQLSVTDGGTPNDPTDDFYINASNRNTFMDPDFGNDIPLGTAPLATSTGIPDENDVLQMYYHDSSGTWNRTPAADLVQTNGSGNTIDNVLADYAVTNRIKNENNPIAPAVISHTINTADGTITFSGTSALNKTHRVLVDENGVTIASEGDFYEVYFYQNDNTNNDGNLNETGIRFFRSGQAIDYTQFGDGNPANLSYRIMNNNKQTLGAPVPIEVATNQPPVPDVANLPNLTAQCSITSLTAPTATDPENGTITATHNETLPITADTTILWTFTDGINTVTQTQEVIINDIDAPTIPANFTISNIRDISADAVSDVSTDNCSAVGYKFYLDDVEVGDNATPDYQYTTLTADTAYEMYNKSYDVNGNLSAKSTSEFITTTLDVENYNQISGFKMYPNPVNDILNIETSGDPIDKVEVYNLLSNKVLSLDNIENNQINTSELSDGVYIIKVYSGNRISTKKLIIGDKRTGYIESNKGKLNLKNLQSANSNTFIGQIGPKVNAKSAEMKKRLENS